MKWRTVLCTALFLCGTVLLSACGGGESPHLRNRLLPVRYRLPLSRRKSPAPSESASSSEPETLPEPEPPKPWDGMVIPEAVRRSGK